MMGPGRRLSIGGAIVNRTAKARASPARARPARRLSSPFRPVAQASSAGDARRREATHWTTLADERQWSGASASRTTSTRRPTTRGGRTVTARAFGVQEAAPTFKRDASFGSRRRAPTRSRPGSTSPYLIQAPSFGLTSARGPAATTARPASSRPRSSRLRRRWRPRGHARAGAWRSWREEELIFKRMMRTSRLDEMEEELRQLRHALAEQKRSSTARSTARQE